MPKLTLVGAGPGDPDLITLKAVKALKNADVVLYDALANKVLLDYCNSNCQKIFVGKKGHCSSITQDSINFLIVEKAYELGHVVRLKGGDPFIFGRGSEEINFARARGVETEYIPGISSIQASGLLDVPLTARGKSEGFWVITGHKSNKELSQDILLASKSNSTLVILMGMSKIAEIQNVYTGQLLGELPFKIIENASNTNEKSISGKVKNMAELVKQNGLKNPAIIIIGETVNALEKIPESINQLLNA